MKCHAALQKSYSCHCEAFLLHLAEVCRHIVTLALSLDLVPFTFSLALSRFSNSTISSTKIPCVCKSPHVYKLKASSLRPRVHERNVPHGSYANVVTLEQIHTTYTL